MLNCVTFDSWTDRTPKPLSAPDFGALCAALNIGDNLHTYTARPKEQTPAFSPAQYAPQATRGRRGVESMTLYVADYDKLAKHELQAVLDYLTSNKLQYAIYSSYSHGKGVDQGATPTSYSFRLLLPLTRPIQPQDWPIAWQLLSARLPVLPDPACKDTARIYGLAHTPFPEHAFAEVQPTGQPWAVPDTSAAANPAAYAAGLTLPTLPLLTKGVWLMDEALAEWQRVLRQHTRGNTDGDMFRRWLLDLVQALRKGTPFADIAQGRHETLLKITQAAERRFKHVTTDAIAEIFRASLDNMAKDPAQGDIDPDKRIAEIQRLLDGARAKRLADIPTADAPLLAAPLSIQPTTGASAPRTDPDDTTPYTLDELYAICAQQRLLPEPDPATALRKRWLLNQGKYYFVLSERGYRGPYTQQDFSATPERLLLRAASAGVVLDNPPTPQGQVRQKTLTQLIREYGAYYAQIAATFSQPFSTYDLPTQTLTEAAAQRRPLPATYNPRVAEWLRKLAGPAHDALLDWLAAVPKLDEPIAGLYICGPSGVGKNLLTVALARLYHAGGPIGLSSILEGRFNSALLGCPIVHADEAMPTNATFENVCECIGTTSRDLLRKFAPNGTLQGAIRMVITANRDDLFAFTHQGRKSYTKEQFQAVAHRILYVPASQAAADYLRHHATDHYQWLTTYDPASGTGEEVSRHILHLAATRTVTRKPGARFLVDGNFDAMLDKFVDRNPLISKIIEFCARYLRNPRPVHHRLQQEQSQRGLKPNTPAAQAVHATYITPGPLDSAHAAQHEGAELYLWLSATFLHACWLHVLDESRKDAPDVPRLLQALQALAPAPDIVPRPEHVPSDMFAIPLRHVLRYNRAVGFDTTNEWRATVRRATAAATAVQAAVVAD